MQIDDMIKPYTLQFWHYFTNLLINGVHLIDVGIRIDYLSEALLGQEVYFGSQLLL